MINFNKDRMSTNHQLKFLIKLLYLASTEGEPKQKDNQKNTTMKSDTVENCGNIALRIIPVYLNPLRLKFISRKN